MNLDPHRDLDNPALLRAAHLTALSVLDAGWLLRKLRYCPATGVAALDVHTPTHRGLTVTSSNSTTLATGCAQAHLVTRLAGLVATMGQRGGDLVGDLAWMLSEYTTPPRLPILRTAYWLLAELIGYGWQIHHLGEDVAAGGFLADIPDDVIAVYPAGTHPDGTAAANLARALPHLDEGALTYLRRVNAVALAHAAHRAR